MKIISDPKTENQSPDDTRMHPPEDCRFKKSIDQSRQTESCDRGTQPIDTSWIRTAGLGNVPERDDQNKSSERNIKEEDPMPGSMFDQPSSENRAEGRSNGRESSPCPDRFTTRFLVKG
jgi:hypothetical protein